MKEISKLRTDLIKFLELVLDLFSYKNSTTQEKDISNKILFYIKSFNESHPINMFSELNQELLKETV
ncbi:MAG: hypothetical protein ACFE8A_05425 [Candidatus Hodarchaeota archaeon]